MRLPRSVWAINTHTNVTPAGCIAGRGQSPTGHRATREEKSQNHHMYTKITEIHHLALTIVKFVTQALNKKVHVNALGILTM